MRKCTPYEFEQLYPTELGTVRADGLAGHFCASDKCHFRLHHHMLTESGERFRISTVGMMLFDENVGYENIGIDEDTKFETMIFTEEVNKFGWLEMDGHELVREFSHNSVSATITHYSMMDEWMEDHK